MFSSQLRYFLYGTVVSISIISLSVSAGETDGVFGDYFTRIIGSCPSNTVVTGFDSTASTYGTRRCSSLQALLGTLFGSSIAPDWQAMIWFNTNGTPRYGDVNWKKSGNDISYMSGNVSVWKLWDTHKICLNGICTTQLPDSQKGDILYIANNGMKWSASDGAILRQEWRNYHVAGCEEYGRILRWSRWLIDSCNTNSDGDYDSVVNYTYNAASVRAIDYLRMGGAPIDKVPACVTAPLTVLCAAWYGCGSYETYHPDIPAFIAIQCITR